jgi:hypothetical protein
MRPACSFHLPQHADPMTEAEASRRLTKDELAIIRRVLAASGDEWRIAEALKRRRLTDEEREHLRGLLVPEILKHDLEADGSLPPEGRAIEDIIENLDVLLRIECRGPAECDIAPVPSVSGWPPAACPRAPPSASVFLAFDQEHPSTPYRPVVVEMGPAPTECPVTRRPTTSRGS